MKQITLSNTDKVALVDDEDYEWLNEWAWRIKHGYVVAGSGGRLSMHRLVAGTPEQGLDVDHINGDKLDNRKENLRFCTRRQNLQNQRKLRFGVCGPKLPTGVSYRKRTNASLKPFQAQIYIRPKHIYLGLFKTPHEASAAYESALVSYGLEQSFSA